VQDFTNLGNSQKGEKTMTTKEKMNSINKTARIAGILFLIMIVASFFSTGFVRVTLIVPGDATATANNIMASESQFRSGIVGHLVVLITDVGVSVLLYVLLKPVSKTLALVAAVFRLIMVAMRGINLVSHFFALQLLSGAGYLTVFETDQLHALVLLFLTAFEDGVLIDYVFFSLHLFFLGYLVFKSGYIPRILGVLLIIGSFGYLTQSLTSFLFPSYEAIVSQFIVPFQISELVFFLWLLIKGVNVEEWEKRALESA
jgi:hypothetical protein